MLNNKQKAEKKLFEDFAKLYPIPPGQVIYRDRPDVIIKGASKVGIELTRFSIEEGHWKISEQRQKDLRDRVVSKAEQMYLGNGGVNYYHHFSFDSNRQILSIEPLASSLFELVNSLTGKLTKEIPKEYFSHIPELSFVYLGSKEYAEAKWHVTQVHETPTLLKERLDEIIQIKGGKCEKYEECDSYWLLITIDYFDRSQDQNFPREKIEGIKSEKFEKIWVFKTVMNQIMKIK